MDFTATAAQVQQLAAEYRYFSYGSAPTVVVWSLPGQLTLTSQVMPSYQRLIILADRSPPAEWWFEDEEVCPF
jgi:hypothetical protein